MCFGENQVTDSGHLGWGNMVEEPILSHFSKEHGQKLIKDFDLMGVEKQASLHGDKWWKAATPDMPDMVHVKNGDVAVIDAKNCSINNSGFHMWKRGVIPPDEILQSHWQMHVAREHYCSNKARGFMHVQLAGQEPESFEVQYDHGLMKKILGVVDDFRDNYVIPKIPPPNDASEEYYNFIKSYFPETPNAEMDADDEIEALMRQYYEQDLNSKTVKESLQYVKNELALKLGNEYSKVKSPLGTFSKSSAAGKVSYQKIAYALKEKLRMSDKKFNEIAEKTRGKNSVSYRFTPSKKLKMEQENE